MELYGERVLGLERHGCFGDEAQKRQVNERGGNAVSGAPEYSGMAPKLASVVGGVPQGPV